MATSHHFDTDLLGLFYFLFLSSLGTEGSYLFASSSPELHSLLASPFPTQTTTPNCSYRKLYPNLLSLFETAQKTSSTKPATSTETSKAEDLVIWNPGKKLDKAMPIALGTEDSLLEYSK